MLLICFVGYVLEKMQPPPGLHPLSALFQSRERDSLRLHTSLNEEEVQVDEAKYSNSSDMVHVLCPMSAVVYATRTLNYPWGNIVVLVSARN